MQKIMSLIAALLFTLSMAAQGKFDPAKFRQEQEAFITKDAHLTQKEAEAFFPIFREYQDKKRQLQHQQGQLMRQKPANDKEAARAISELSDLKVQEAKLDASYNKRFASAIPATKALQSLRAAERHKHQFMRNFMPRNAQQGKQGQHHNDRRKGQKQDKKQDRK